MRLATVISLLLFACAACALQLHHEERRDGFRSLVIPRRSFQSISRRRLVSRRIGSSTGPDIVPRDSPMYHSEFSILEELKSVEKKDLIKSSFSGRLEIYKIKLPQHFGEKQLVVKKIDSTLATWHETDVQKEASGLARVNQLIGVLFDGKTYYILMEDMGDKWVRDSSPKGHEAFQLMEQADKRCEEEYGMKRVYPPWYPRISFDDYTWTRHKDGSWEVHLVGEWRFGQHTGSPNTPVPKNGHYYGIKEWKGDLPVFLRLNRPILHVSVGHIAAQIKGSG